MATHVPGQNTSLLYTRRVKLDLLKLRIVQGIAWAGPVTTIVVNPWGNFDPISVVKMVALSTFAFLVLSLLIVGRKKLDLSQDRYLIATAIFFVFWMLMVILFSGAPLNQQIWGTFGRNTGFLTYFSLVILLVGAATIRDHSGYKKITDALLVVSVPLTGYCLIQMTGNDPIGWSYKSTFGTLGNVNFLSAFMGLVTVVAFSYAVNYLRRKKTTAFLFLVLISVDLVIVFSTSSIQGLIMFASGTTVILFLWMATLKRRVMIQSMFSLIVIAIGTPVVLGIFNIGPLGRFLFQNSTKLRGDYIHAGWEMTTKFPIFGVGMDTYGDWYRQLRGEISTLAGPDRTANTAHNIFLDISSNGGFPLLCAYLAFFLIAIRSAFRYYRSNKGNFDPVFSALVAAWIAYQMQALISINQIGVGIWAWVFTGSLIGYAHLASSNSNNSVENARKKLKGQLLPPAAGLLALGGATLGFLLAWIPLRADAQFAAATRERSLEKTIKASRVFGATVWHSEMALDTALRIPAATEAQEIATYLVTTYPRDVFGWKILYLSGLSTPEVRNQALSRLLELDPFYPDWRS